MRRTKQDAEQTRQRILDAALEAFRRDGVSRTTLDDIARAAGVTRGAIYWHFDNKKALFRALRERVELPLIDRTDFALLQDPGTGDPLLRIQRFLIAVLDVLGEDPNARHTIDILMYRCEYVGELAKDLDDFVCQVAEVREKLERAYADADRQGLLRTGLTPTIAAIETTMLVVGLVRLWVISDESSPIRTRARETIAAHVAGRRCPAGSPVSTQPAG